MSKWLQCVLMYYILYCCSALALLHLLNTHSLKWSTFFSLFFFCIAWMYVFWSCWKAHVTLEQCIQFLLRTYLHLRSIEDTLCSLPWLIWLYSHQLSKVFYHDVAFHTKSKGLISSTVCMKKKLHKSVHFKNTVIARFSVLSRFW